MQLISGFVDTYLRLDDTEKQVFQTAISTMGLDEQEEIMEDILEQMLSELMRY